MPSASPDREFDIRRSSAPTGTLTFLFTEIEGSKRMWQAAPDAMQAALVRHDATLRHDVEAHGGHVFKAAGDAFFAIGTADASFRAKLSHSLGRSPAEGSERERRDRRQSQSDPKPSSMCFADRSFSSAPPDNVQDCDGATVQPPSRNGRITPRH
jgi:class 3 adenylate cyclase